MPRCVGSTNSSAKQNWFMCTQYTERLFEKGIRRNVVQTLTIGDFVRLGDDEGVLKDRSYSLAVERAAAGL